MTGRLVALCTTVVLFSTVGCDMFLKTSILSGCIVALCAFVHLFFNVKELVSVEVFSSTE